MSHSEKKDPVINHNAMMSSMIVRMKELPPCELNYYIALLMSSIQNETNPQQYDSLISKTSHLLDTLSAFYKTDGNDAEQLLDKVYKAVNDLIITSKMKTTPHQIKKILLSICSVVNGIILGVLGGVAGFSASLFSGFGIIGNIKLSPIGFLTGFALGGYIGSRCLDVVFQSAFERKLELCIHNIGKVSGELSSKKTKDEYDSKIKDHILGVFFKDTPPEEQDEAYNVFLKSDQEFQVCTITASFIEKKLKGNVGHHTMIKYTINGITDIPIEFGDRIKTPNFLDQHETPRKVKGQKLVDMLVLDHVLQETHAYSKHFLINKYDLGSNDCRSYIDKVLIGTHQPPTKIQRFNPAIDKKPGIYFVSRIIGFFSKTRENELKPFLEHFKDGNEPTITANKWPGAHAKKESATPDSASPARP